ILNLFKAFNFKSIVKCRVMPALAASRVLGILLIFDHVKKSFIRQLPDYAQIFCLVKNQNNFNLTAISDMTRH
ncbi:MAG: hypothetical protein MI892_20600, partial [Desulfobacterales bacterium]|nr:hypothetical protein [Desulfobacterales bacterium]